jgi:transposase
MKIPTQVTEQQFDQYIKPHLSTAKRGYESEQPLYQIFNYILYKLYTGCQWEALPIAQAPDGRPIMSYQVPYYHFRKWSSDGSLQRLFDASIISIQGELNLSELNVDGSHSAAKKGAKASAIKAARKPRPAISCH